MDRKIVTIYLLSALAVLEAGYFAWSYPRHAEDISLEIYQELWDQWREKEKDRVRACVDDTRKISQARDFDIPLDTPGAMVSQFVDQSGGIPVARMGVISEPLKPVRGHYSSLQALHILFQDTSCITSITYGNFLAECKAE